MRKLKTHKECIVTWYVLRLFSAKTVRESVFLSFTKYLNKTKPSNMIYDLPPTIKVKVSTSRNYRKNVTTMQIYHAPGRRVRSSRL